MSNGATKAELAYARGQADTAIHDAIKFEIQLRAALECAQHAANTPNLTGLEEFVLKAMTYQLELAESLRMAWKRAHELIVTLAAQEQPPTEP